MPDPTISNPAMPESISGLSAIAQAYAAILCDVWGVIHNGVRRFQPACDALVAFRKGGGRVVLITNAPRPAAPVRRQLDGLGVPAEAYDAIVTSGDVTRHAIVDSGWKKVLGIGPERDAAIYAGLPIELVEEPEAEGVCCTGLFDDNVETPADYEERMQRWAKRDLAMICANPDLVVERGDRLLYCAGALAQRYAEIGGRTLLAGKPYPPIYEMAMEMLAERSGAAVPRERVMVIGDGAPTDIKGAVNEGLDALFITHGIHAAEWQGEAMPSGEDVASFLARSGLKARAAMPRLSW